MESNTKRHHAHHRHRTIIPSFGLLGLALGLTLRLGRQIGYSLERALRVPMHHVPVDTISCALRVARRGVIHFSCRSSYREDTLAASQRRCKPVRSFTTLLAEGILGESAYGITKALLEVLDVLLV